MLAIPGAIRPRTAEQRRAKGRARLPFPASAAPGRSCNPASLVVQFYKKISFTKIQEGAYEIQKAYPLHDAGREGLSSIRPGLLNTKAIPRLNIPSILLTDGPHGLRKQAGKHDNLGLNAFVPAACYSNVSALANSWDPESLEALGQCSCAIKEHTRI